MLDLQIDERFEEDNNQGRSAVSEVIVSSSLTMKVSGAVDDDDRDESSQYLHCPVKNKTKNWWPMKKNDHQKMRMKKNLKSCYCHSDLLEQRPSDRSLNSQMTSVVFSKPTIETCGKRRRLVDASSCCGYRFCCCCLTVRRLLVLAVAFLTQMMQATKRLMVIVVVIDVADRHCCQKYFRIFSSSNHRHVVQANRPRVSLTYW